MTTAPSPPRPPVELRSPRLLLRRVAASDAPLLFAAWTGDAGTMRYLQWRPHTNPRETEELVRDCLKAWEEGEKFYFVVTHGPSGEAVGFASLRIEEGCRASLGFLTFAGHRGKGYAAEMIRALADWALAQPALWRVYGLCDAENVASARAMASAGMQREGVWRRWAVHPNLGPDPRDVVCFARVRGDA